MRFFVTDNPVVHKSIPGSELLYYIFDWKSKKIDEGDDSSSYSIDFSYKWKKPSLQKKISLHSEVSCIVAASNYRLLYDLLFLKNEIFPDVRFEFFTWNGWANRRKFNPKEDAVRELFLQYMQRGFLSRSMYFELGGLNFQRIEQFILSLFVFALEKKIIVREKIPVRGNELGDIVFFASRQKDRGFLKAMEKVVYHYRNGDIADPFLDLKISFTKKGKKHSLFKLYEYMRQEGIFEVSDLHLALSFLWEIMPYVDIYKTFLFLLKNGLISCDKNGRCTSSLGISEAKAVEYLPYLDASLWKEVYSLSLYSFSGIFPYISAAPASFSCPKCGSIKYKTEPLWFRCGNFSCGFKIKRAVNPLGKKKRLKPEEFKRLVHHGFVYVKNSAGGYSKYVLKKNPDGSYWACPS